MDKGYKITARDCPVCKENKKIYIARMKRKENSNKYYCDGCNNTMSDEQIDEKWKSLKTRK